MFIYLKSLGIKNIITLAFSSILFFSCQDRHKSNEETKIDRGKIKEGVPSYKPINQELYDTILKLDEKFWKAYNEGNIKVIEEFTSEEHEFYHDGGGVTKTKAENMKQWESHFSNRSPIKGIGLKKFNEVYEIPDFGALHVGYQKFFNAKNPDGTPPSRVITLWKETEDGWKQEYVFSTHAHPADVLDSIQVFDLQKNKQIRMRNGFEYGFINDYYKYYMQKNSVDTVREKQKFQLVFHYPGKINDTLISTGKYFKFKNASNWVNTSEDLINKYRND